MKNGICQKEANISLVLVLHTYYIQLIQLILRQLRGIFLTEDMLHGMYLKSAYCLW